MDAIMPKGPLTAAANAAAPSPRTSPGARTELPADKTVQTVGQNAETRLTYREAAAQEPKFREIVEQQQQQTFHHVARDPDTGSMIFRAIDTNSGIVKSQIPSEAILKLRVYAKEIVTEQAQHLVEKKA